MKLATMIATILMSAAISCAQINSADSSIRSQAREYFQAVIDGDVETLYKYVHPKALEKLGSKAAVIEGFDDEYDYMLENGMEFESIEIIEQDISSATAEIRTIIKFSRADGFAAFCSLTEVYRFEGKNYFIDPNGHILESFELLEIGVEDSNYKCLEPKI